MSAAADCWRCRRGDDDSIWSDEHWLLAPLEKPGGLPVIVILQPREHCDLGDLPVLIDGSAKNAQQSLYASASLDKRSSDVVLKVVNAASSPRAARVKLDGVKAGRKIAREIVLASSDLKAENSLDQPTRVSPIERRLTVSSGEFSYTFAPSSVTVLRIPAP